MAWNEIYVAGLSEKEKERFSSEVELLRSIDDDHFIKYYSSVRPEGGEGDYHYADCEQRDAQQVGFPLRVNRSYVKGKQLTMEAIKRWSVQILEGLQVSAHAESPHYSPRPQVFKHFHRRKDVQDHDRRSGSLEAAVGRHTDVYRRDP